MYLEKMGFLLDFRVEFIIKLAKTMINLLFILQKQESEPECRNEAKKEHNKGKGAETSRCIIPGTRLHLKADSEISRGQNVTEQSGRTRENSCRDSTQQSIKEKDRLANLGNKHRGAFRANTQELLRI